MKNLENFGVQELGTNQIKNINGGGNFAKLVGWVYGRIARDYHYNSSHSWGGF